MPLFSKSITLRQDLKITDEEFRLLRDFIYAQSGIHIRENRKYLLENRLANRLKELNLKNFGEYYYFLKYDPGRKQELAKLFEVITTNETSFFRNPPQLSIFQDKILPDILDKQRKSKDKSLRIWSAGCSTGEEPYTLAIILFEVLGWEISQWNIKITANDLSPAVIKSAERGIYTKYTLRTTPEEIKKRYFQEEGPGKYKLDPKVKNLVRFGQLNLSDRFQIKNIERSHVIFCRNVIIYFDDEMKKNVINSFYDNLLPGGYLFIGHSESLHNISRAFTPLHHPGAIVYRKSE
jgi:chemotaxis protein methyltransferase CheR